MVMKLDTPYRVFYCYIVLKTQRVTLQRKNTFFTVKVGVLNWDVLGNLRFCFSLLMQILDLVTAHCSMFLPLIFL